MGTFDVNANLSKAEFFIGRGRSWGSRTTLGGIPALEAFSQGCRGGISHALQVLHGEGRPVSTCAVTENRCVEFRRDLADLLLEQTTAYVNRPGDRSRRKFLGFAHVNQHRRVRTPQQSREVADANFPDVFSRLRSEFQIAFFSKAHGWKI